MLPILFVCNYSIYPTKDSELGPQAVFPESSLRKSLIGVEQGHTFAEPEDAQG